MSLRNGISPETKIHIMVQRRKRDFKPLPDSTQEEKENEETGLNNALNSRDTRFIAGRALPSSSPLQTTPEIEPKEAIAPPLYDERWCPPLKTYQGTQFSQRTSLAHRQSKSGRPAHWILWDSYLFSTINLLNWKNSNPSYRDDPREWHILLPPFLPLNIQHRQMYRISSTSC